MTFTYISDGYRHVREYFDPIVYHIDDVPDNACFASTPDLEQSYYFLRNAHGTYVALDKLIASYSTSEADDQYLNSIKQQYIPETLI